MRSSSDTQTTGSTGMSPAARPMIPSAASVSRFYGITIQMFFKDGRPHFAGGLREQIAVFTIDPGGRARRASQARRPLGPPDARILREAAAASAPADRRRPKHSRRLRQPPRHARWTGLWDPHRGYPVGTGGCPTMWRPPVAVGSRCGVCAGALCSRALVAVDTLRAPACPASTARATSLLPQSRGRLCLAAATSPEWSRRASYCSPRTR